MHYRCPMVAAVPPIRVSRTRCPLRLAAASPSLLPSLSRRSFSQTVVQHSVPAGEGSLGDSKGLPHVAVVGGGLTGLGTALNLARSQRYSVTLYHEHQRLGGWIESIDQLPDGSHLPVKFERGARAIGVSGDPKNWDHLFLAHLLVSTPEQRQHSLLALKFNQASEARYVYYPDKLVEVPPSLYGLFTEPLFENRWQTLISLVRNARRIGPEFMSVHPDYHADTSMGHFIDTIFGEHNSIRRSLSALLAGSYGGSPDHISLNASAFAATVPNLSSFSGIYDVSSESMVSDLDYLLRAHYERLYRNQTNEYRLNLAYFPLGSFISFPNGAQSLTDFLADQLQCLPNVTIKKAQVENLQYDHEKNVIRVKDSHLAAASYDRVFSTTDLSRLHLMIARESGLPSLQSCVKGSDPANILVVNVWFPNKDLKKNRGFGHLIPAYDTEKYNPNRALGVIYDSDIHGHGSRQQPGTNLTVMFGGHYWKGRDAKDIQAEWTPEVIETRSLAVLSDQLGIPGGEEGRMMAHKFCWGAIPQHTVGHGGRMAALHRDLLDKFGGKLAVGGPAYTRPGVLGAARAAYLLSEVLPNERERFTGLEMFGECYYRDYTPRLKRDIKMINEEFASQAERYWADENAGWTFSEDEETEGIYWYE